MSDPHSKHYQRTTGFHIEHYFRSNSYQTTIQLYKKKFHDTPDIRTKVIAKSKVGSRTMQTAKHDVTGMPLYQMYPYLKVIINTCGLDRNATRNK